jgi:hypothetical protein
MLTPALSTFFILSPLSFLLFIILINKSVQKVPLLINY